ncbi:ferric reductase like transmembrane component domain-containing protein [Trichoderma austrokoningii]
MDMNAAWLSGPIQLHSSRAFECDELTAEECDWYKQRWHYWYIADYVFALPTVAFFMCAIGIFIIGNVVSQILGYRRYRGPPIWQKLIAGIRYLSYRGYYIKSLRWNSAPVGILLLGLAGTIFFFCMDLIPQPYYWPSEIYGNSPALATRSGWMGLACMPFIFATASKANWITLFTGVSYERLQVFHRWISYAFFILALLHTFPFIVYHIRWHDMEKHFASSLVFYWTGIVALLLQAWLTFASHSSIRNLGYEFFKATHLFAVVIFMIMFFWHCGYTLTSWDYFIATAAVYVPCYVYPWLRTCFRYGINSKAQIVAQDNGFVRMTIPVNFHWRPGQHCFLRFTSFGLFHAISAHPFTICSSPSEKPGEQSQLTFYIRPEKGFTAKLYQYALDQPGGSIPLLVDGPYGGINMQRYQHSDHVLVVAGGSGAGWCLPFIERIGSVSDEKNFKEEGHNIHALEREFKGRPQLPQIIQEATRVADAGQSLSVFVCGPTTMQNDVRNAVAKENLKILQGSGTGAVYLHTEHFSWA